MLMVPPDEHKYAHHDKTKLGEILKKYDIDKSIVEEEYFERGEIEFYIPVVINNKNVPQLRWGHADFAQFLNSKGFNFLTFKHKDLD